MTTQLQNLVLPTLAHQGGWDEVLLVAAPLSLFAGLLYLANRRADLVAHGRPDDHDGSDSGSGGGDDEDRDDE